jgi:hypothetical protein
MELVSFKFLKYKNGVQCSTKKINLGKLYKTQGCRATRKYHDGRNVNISSYISIFRLLTPMLNRL